LKGAAIAAMLLGSSVANSEPATYLSPNARAELASALHLYDNDCAPIGQISA
jgi:hypothetical protein